MRDAALEDPLTSLDELRKVPGMSVAGISLNDEKGVPSNDTVQFVVRAIV